MQHVTFQVNGMSCSHCVNAVTQALSAVPGVAVEHVEIGKATVAYEPDKTRTTDITDALQDAGYEAHATP